MDKKEAKLTGIVIAILAIMLMIPTIVLADANTDLQMIHSTKGDYLIYVKDMADSSFEFAISAKENESELDLSYTKSVKDEAGNQVAYVKEADKDNAKYLYIKHDEKTNTYAIDLSKAFEQSRVENVETTTKRISTEVLKDQVIQEEVKDGISYKTTVQGLEITDPDKADYFYTQTKLPAESYTELVQLADQLNGEYKNMSMFDKLVTAQKFDTLYQSLLQEQKWNPVKDKKILQPEDAQNGDTYVVFLKKVAKDGRETYDVKIMQSSRKDDENKKPEQTETKTVKETTKLPITGDSLAILIAFVVIVLAAILVGIRMKKLKEKKDSK